MYTVPDKIADVDAWKRILLHNIILLLPKLPCGIHVFSHTVVALGSIRMYGAHYDACCKLLHREHTCLSVLHGERYAPQLRLL